jgi:hypothetical protein
MSPASAGKWSSENTVLGLALEGSRNNVFSTVTLRRAAQTVYGALQWA